MVSHAACMIWHSILCNHTGKCKHAGHYICLELYTCKAQTLNSWLSAPLQASDDDAPQQRQDAARQKQQADNKHKRRRLWQRPDPAASAGPSSAITDEAALQSRHPRKRTKRVRALGIRQPGLPQCLAHCQIVKVIRGPAL